MRVLSYFPLFIALPSPLSLSEERERGGEYIKGKEFVIYILYIENSFHILYTPLSCPFRGGSGSI